MAIRRLHLFLAGALCQRLVLLVAPFLMFVPWPSVPQSRHCAKATAAAAFFPNAPRISPAGVSSKRRTARRNINELLSFTTTLSASGSTSSSSSFSRAAVEFSDLLPHPHPSLSATDVVSACMNTLIGHDSSSKRDIGLQVCFAFSSDRCRAALGGSLDQFLQYADNPTFGYLVHCQSWDIVSVGPIIPGTPHRGAMQTVLMVARTRASSSTAPSSSLAAAAAESIIPNVNNDDDDDDEETTPNNQDKDCGRPFLWTLQMERRPPLQGCWMVHEVLYTPNAYLQTV